MGLLDGLIASLPDAKGSAPSSKSTSGGGEIEALLRNKAAEYDIDPDLFVGLAKRESGLRPDAKNTGSTAGGLFQFIDGTWSRYGNKKDKFDPEANADAAARMMRDHLGMFDGDYNKALAAHHVGAGKAASALTDRRVGDKDVSTQQWLSEIYKHAGRDNPLATPRGAFGDAEAGVGGYDQIRQGQVAQAASDESPVSTSLKRGVKGLTNSAGLAIDNMMGDSQGAAQRIIDKQAFDQATPAPSSVQKFGRDWDALAEDDYSGMFGTILKNPAGSFNMMLEQTPNSLPGMAFQTIAGVAGRGLMALGPVGAAAGLGLQGLSAFAGNFLPEGGAFIEEQLHKSGVDTTDVNAVAKWIEEHRGENFKGGATKAGVISAVDGVTGWMGMKMLAGPSVRFAQAEKNFFAKNGVNVADSAALKAARASDGYKAAMQPFAADLVKASEGFGMLKRGVGATALDALGEGVGEYAGTYAATGDASIKDAVLEGVMGVGQGAAMAGASYGIGKMSGPDQAMEELRKLAEANIAPPAAKPNSPLSNAAQAAQSSDPITEALKPISERFADRGLYAQIRNHPNLGPDAMNQILSAYRVATNANMDPMARQAAVDRLGEFFRLFDNQPNFTAGNNQAEQAGGLPVVAGSTAVGQADPRVGAIDGEATPIGQDPRGNLLDRVLASNPENPNRAFDRALRLEGFRDATFTEDEKEKIARFNALRAATIESQSGANQVPVPGAPAVGYQHLADMIDSGWTPDGKGSLVSPNGDRYAFKGRGEIQFVRNKLNKKAGNGNQSVRNDPQGGGAQGDLGARGAGIDGAVSESGGNGSAEPSQDQNSATPDGAVQPAEAAGNGSAPNGNVDPGQWLNEEDELNSWFGNSVVVGPDGRPMTVYHTTYKVMDEAISEFDRNHLTKINPDTGRRRKSPSLDSVGVWFSNNPAKTDAYGEGAQYPAHLKITRPVVYRTFDDLLKDWNNFHAKGFANPKLAELHQKQNEFFGDADGFVANLKQRGFDGLIILPHERAASGEDMGSTEFKDQTAYIVFDGSQIRSVFDRRQGEFVAAESEQVAQEAQETNDAQAEQASAAAPETEGLAAQDGNNPAITKPENARRNIIANGGVVEETQAINNVEYPELPGITFFTRQTPEGKFNVVDERSGYAVFIGAPSEEEAINNFRTRVVELGIDNVRARLESQKAIDAPKQETDDERAARIKATKPADRDPKDVNWYNNRGRVNPEESAKQKTEEIDLRGFADGMPKIKGGKAKTVLKKQVSNNGVFRSRKEIVEEAIDGGGRVDHRTDGRRLVKNNGDFISESDLGSTALDYAEFLLKNKHALSQQKTDNPETPAANQAPAITAENDNKPFDSDAWDKERDDRIKASREAGNTHLDRVPAYVETMRGKEIYNVHDTKERGVIRTVDNRGNVYVNWSDAYSAEKNLASPSYEGKKQVFQTTLGPTDLKDYVLAEKSKAATVNAKNEPKSEQPTANSESTVALNQQNSADSDFERGKAMMGEGIDKLIALLGGKTNMLPEEEAQIIPVMSQIFRGAALMGYAKFKEASRFVLDTLRAKSPEVADKIDIENLQAGYINAMKSIEGASTKAEIIEFDSVDQLYEERAQFQGRIAAAEQRTALNPTEAQKESGIYAKGKFAWKGMTISIETPKGAERSGTDESGQRWSITAPTSYGYFLGTTAADKEHLDVYIGDKPESDRVYVINQTKVDSPKFDEHKILIGFDSEEGAKQAYFGAFSEGFAPRVFGSMAGPFSVDEFKAMLPKLEKSRFIEDRVADKSERLNRLPDGWNGTVGGIATNKDPVRGGIVDKTIATGEWFYVPHDESLETVDGFKSQQEAIDALQKAVEKRAKYLKTTEKFKEKQAERAIVPLDQITVTRSATLDGKEVEYDQKADDALNEIDGQMTLAKRLLECLAA